MEIDCATLAAFADDPDEPVLDQIAANSSTLVLGCVAGIAFGIVGLLLTGIVAPSRSPNAWAGWAMLVFSAIVVGATLRQLIWPVPLVEVTRRGLRLRIGAPMRRSGLRFIPWSHARSVVFTQIKTSKGGREDALGFQINQDENLRLPEVRWNSAHAAPEATACEVVFAASMIGGDVREWVRRIEERRPRAG